MTGTHKENRPLYMQIAHALQSIQNCKFTGNTEWQERHSDRLEWLLFNHLPSGSGFDDQAILMMEQSGPDNLQFRVYYHPLDDVGAYDEWVICTVIVTPSLVDKVDIDIRGCPLEEGLGDYICETYWDAMTKVVNPPPYPLETVVKS